MPINLRAPQLKELKPRVVVCGVDSVERDLGLTHTRYVALVFSLPLAVAALLEIVASLASEAGSSSRRASAAVATHTFRGD